MKKNFNKKQKGGNDVSMPIQFFGQELKNYYEKNSSMLNTPDSAYGPTHATSHGNTLPNTTNFVGPDLAPFSSKLEHSGIQTGGNKLNLECPNADCGAPFHPRWSLKGGKKNKSFKKKQTGKNSTVQRKQNSIKYNKQQQQQEQQQQQQSYEQQQEQQQQQSYEQQKQWSFKQQKNKKNKKKTFNKVKNNKS
jgi:hypothetical protein